MLELSLGLALGEASTPHDRDPLMVGDPTTGAIVAVVPRTSPNAEPAAPIGGLWRRMVARWTAAPLYIPH
jgi:hypothetical protein